MTRNVRRNLQLRLKVARNAKQKPQQPSKVEINTKQFVQRLSKWQETQNNAHYFLQGRYCLAFLSILGLKRRNCLAFPATYASKSAYITKKAAKCLVEWNKKPTFATLLSPLDGKSQGSSLSFGRVAYIIKR